METASGSVAAETVPQISASGAAKRTFSTAQKLDDQSANDEQPKQEVPEKRFKGGEHYKSRKPVLKTGPVVDNPEYYLEDGFRKVRPYWFQFTTAVKGRWFGRTVSNVLAEEMHAKDPEFFNQQLKLGRITVNEKRATPDMVLKNNDILQHLCHRHEMPVLDKPIKVVVNDDDVVIVDKPCSLPVHPCGRYYFNSLVSLLRIQHGIDDLKITHRLDRLTSGLTVFAKTLQKAQAIAAEHQKRKISKEYLCRVEGEFPEGEIICEQPMKMIFGKMGVQGVSPDGKECRTRFEKLWTNGKESVVRCFPLTGRTHQIRVHLQYLGYPIVNDHMYNNVVFGPEKGKGGNYGKSMEQLQHDITEAFGAEGWVDDYENSLAAFTEKKALLKPNTEGSTDSNLPVSPHYDPYCPDCHMISRCPQLEQLTMYLHCLAYQGEGWSYSTEVPEWAKEDVAVDDNVAK